MAVIGVNNGTKHLQQFLHCTKEYRVIGLLGTATTSYDTNEPVMRRAPHRHVTRDGLAKLLSQFTGDIQQTPPLYSAVRIDGKRLFEYAREGIPLPRPVESRPVTVHELRVVDWLEPGMHAYKAPSHEISHEEQLLLEKAETLAGVGPREAVAGRSGADAASGERSSGGQVSADAASDERSNASPPGMPPPRTETTITDATTVDATDDAAAFALEMTVSSGTYVRTIVHDLGAACGSAAHVVKLVRTRQGEFALGHEPDGKSASAIPSNCIPWAVFERAIADLEASPQGAQAPDEKADADELREWERVILQQCVLRRGGSRTASTVYSQTTRCNRTTTCSAFCSSCMYCIAYCNAIPASSCCCFGTCGPESVRSVETARAWIPSDATRSSPCRLRVCARYTINSLSTSGFSDGSTKRRPTSSSSDSGTQFSR